MLSKKKPAGGKCGWKTFKITQFDKLGQTVGQSIITPAPAASLL